MALPLVDYLENCRSLKWSFFKNFFFYVFELFLSKVGLE